MREFLTIDQSTFPIVLGKYNRFIPTNEEFIKAQTDIEMFCQCHENFVIVLDFSEVPVLSSEYRIASAKWAAKTDPLFVKKKMKIVFYTPSVILQVIFKGVLLLNRPGVPHTIASSLEEAKAWAQKQLNNTNS